MASQRTTCEPSDAEERQGRKSQISALLARRTDAHARDAARGQRPPSPGGVVEWSFPSRRPLAPPPALYDTLRSHSLNP